MKKLALVLLLLGGISQPVEAQIKLPVFDPNLDTPGTKEVVFKPATQARDFRHGAMLSLTMNGKETKMAGTLVRVDRKTRRLYVRTEPGAMPVAVEEKDIKQVDKGVYAIRPAGTADDQVMQPEIQKVVVYNGTVASVTYTAASLSPGERTYLQGLQDAENELMRMQGRADAKVRIFDTELAIQAERKRSSEIINKMISLQQWNLGRTTLPTTWGNYVAPFVMPNSPFGFGGSAGILGLTSSSSNAITVSSDQQDLLKVAMPTMQDTMDISTARETLAAAQARMVYEDGRLVAVVLKE